MNAVSGIGDLQRQWLAGQSRVLVCGPQGVDRIAPLIEAIGGLAAKGASYSCLSTDLSLPPFGPPGTVTLARWRGERWQLMDSEALCSLDALRFRLPLISALERILLRHPSPGLFLLAPGLPPGVAGAELVTELLHRARIDTVWWQADAASAAPFRAEFEAAGATLLTTPGRIATFGNRERREWRSRSWREHLVRGRAFTLSLDTLHLLGTPPPRDAGVAWRGRQIALLEDGVLRTLGEVTRAEGRELLTRLASNPGAANQLLVRDAVVRDGLLVSSKPHRPQPASLPKSSAGVTAPTEVTFTKRAACGPVPVARLGGYSACLVNGVFGDPLLKLQLLHQRRSLLFDLGDPGRLAARVAHQVSDVFLSHTHADHIGGFLWFLRSRIGNLPPCRCYGPPGVARQIAGMVDGILWDRVENRAPRFIVHEWHGDHLRQFRVTAGEPGTTRLRDLPLADGVVWREPGFLVRAAALDHRTMVLAYAYEPAMQIKVCRDRLQARGLATGRWLQQLKEAVLAGEDGRLIELPDGNRQPAAALRRQVLQTSPGGKLVYATDFADTADNRARLVALARDAHNLFCEASFMLAHRDQARRTQHLTTTACGEIANAAGVRHLLPFHFSKRYIKHAPAVYAEIRRVCPRTVVPDIIDPATTPPGACDDAGRPRTAAGSTGPGGCTAGRRTRR